MNFTKTRFFASTILSFGVALSIPSGFAADQAKSKNPKAEQAAGDKAEGPAVAFLEPTLRHHLEQAQSLSGAQSGEKGPGKEKKGA